MKSQKGITMLSLIIYISSFLVISGIIAGITMFFYNNNSLMDAQVYSAAEFNKFNMYMVDESEQVGNRVSKIMPDNAENNSSNIDCIIFSNGDQFTLDRISKILYYNRIALCEDVNGLKVKREYTSGKEVLNVIIEFTNKSYSCKYTMMQ